MSTDQPTPRVGRPSRVYVASSWRNPDQPAVVAALRERGFLVYDFRNPPGRTGFAWSSIDPTWQDWTADQYIAALDHPLAEAGFASDFDAMKWADTFVLVLPCGRSAHLELGWAVGAGKRTVIITQDGEEPELMAKMVDHIAVGLDDALDFLGEPDAPHPAPVDGDAVERAVRAVNALAWNQQHGGTDPTTEEIVRTALTAARAGEAVETDESRHGPWDKSQERYEDGCRYDEPHDAGEAAPSWRCGKCDGGDLPEHSPRGPKRAGETEHPHTGRENCRTCGGDCRLTDAPAAGEPVDREAPERPTYRPLIERKQIAEALAFVLTEDAGHHLSLGRVPGQPRRAPKCSCGWHWTPGIDGTDHLREVLDEALGDLIGEHLHTVLSARGAAAPTVTAEQVTEAAGLLWEHQTGYRRDQAPASAMEDRRRQVRRVLAVLGIEVRG